MSFPTAVLACGSMHLPWWVGPLAIYLMIGWGIGALLAPINLIWIAGCQNSKDFKVVNIVLWALYALPIFAVALTFCHVITQVPPMPGWIVGTLCVHSLLVPLLALGHTIFLARRISWTSRDQTQQPELLT